MTQDILLNIPKDIENLHLPNPELLEYYLGIQERVIWITNEIDTYTLDISKKILNWNRLDKDVAKKDRKPIKLLIHSYGGDLDINDSLIDVIKLSDTPVYGYNMGVAASAACFIFMSCHKRFAMPKSTFLIHKGGAENISGTFDQVISYIEEYQRKIELLADFILEHSKIDEETLQENICTEWYIDAKTAIEYGICDRVIKNISEII